MNQVETLNHIEDLGRQRRSKNTDIFEDGHDPEDTFTQEESGMCIHDPWKSSCGRFEVDPYKEYGREFIIWLFKPFYTESSNG